MGFFQISNGWAFWFQIPFKIQTIHNPTSLQPFKIQTNSDFRSTMHILFEVSSRFTGQSQLPRHFCSMHSESEKYMGSSTAPLFEWSAKSRDLTIPKPDVQDVRFLDVWFSDDYCTYKFKLHQMLMTCNFSGTVVSGQPERKAANLKDTEFYCNFCSIKTKVIIPLRAKWVGEFI